MSIELMTAVRKLPIKPSGRKFVAYALADYADENGSCWPSVAMLAEYTGQSARSVRDHLDALERDGFLIRKRTRNSAGQLGQYRYKINQRQISPAANLASGEKPQKPVAKSAAHNHQTDTYVSLEPSDKPNRRKKSYSKCFETFWAEYPEHGVGSKAKAFETWKLMDQTERQAAMASLPVYRLALEQPNAPRCAHAVTFLNGRRWETMQPGETHITSNPGGSNGQPNDNTTRRRAAFAGALRQFGHGTAGGEGEFEPDGGSPPVRRIAS